MLTIDEVTEGIMGFFRGLARLLARRLVVFPLRACRVILWDFLSDLPENEEFRLCAFLPCNPFASYRPLVLIRSSHCQGPAICYSSLHADTRLLMMKTDQYDDDSDRLEIGCVVKRSGGKLVFVRAREED